MLLLVVVIAAARAAAVTSLSVPFVPSTPRGMAKVKCRFVQSKLTPTVAASPEIKCQIKDINAGHFAMELANG